jgi:hypothetical protein
VTVFDGRDADRTSCVHGVAYYSPMFVC